MNRLLFAGPLMCCVLVLSGQDTRKADPASAPIEVLLSKARAMEGRGRLDLAAQTWQQVLMADPKQAEALAGLARFATQSGDPAQAKAYTDRLRQLDPNHPAIAQVESKKISGQQQARLQEAARLVRNRQMEQAVQIYREVFGDNPPPGGWAIAYYEALAATSEGWEQATAGLAKMMEKFPQSAEYRLSLGTLQTYRPASRLNGMRLLEGVRGNNLLMNKARQAWRQALVWEGQNPNIQASLKAYLERYPDPELQKLEAHLPHVEKAAPTAVRSKDETAGYKALQAGNVKEAEARFDAALKASPRSVAALSGMGFVRMKQEDFAAAETLFASAKEEAPHDGVISEALEGAHFWATMKAATTDLAANRPTSVGLYRDALALRPDNVDAMHGLAGALMHDSSPREAVPLFDKLLQRQPENADLWRETLNAKYQSGGGAAALAFARQIPDGVQTQLAGNIEYHALLATALSDAGHNAESKQQLQRGIDLANAHNRELPVSVQMQFAGLYLRHGYFPEAASLFRDVTANDPGNASAWEGLLSALVQNHQEAAAKRAAERMPKPVYETALGRPGFLRSLSSLEMALGSLDTAEEFLKKSLDLEGAVDTRATVSAQLQLAQIWLRKGQPRKAEALLRKLGESEVDNPDIWKTLISVLHQEGRDEDVMLEAAHLPASVRATLNSDPDYTNLLVSAWSRLGQLDEALRLARRATTLLEQQGRPVPADLQIQTAWLLLNTQSDDRELYSTLTRAGAEPDLTKEQQQGIESIWTVWSLRRSESAVAAGDLERSISILEAASKVLPGNPKLQSTLAGSLLKAGNTKRALTVYFRWRLKGAEPSDYAGAIGAAMSEKQDKIASEWLTEARAQWPWNGELLNLAGKLAAANGDYKKAAEYWTAAMTSLRREELVARQAKPEKAPLTKTEPDPIKGLGQLLLDDQALPDMTTRKPRGVESGNPAPVMKSAFEPSNRVLPVPRRITELPAQPGRRNSDTDVAVPKFEMPSLPPLDNSDRPPSAANRTPPAQRPLLPALSENTRAQLVSDVAGAPSAWQMRTPTETGDRSTPARSSLVAPPDSPAPVATPRTTKALPAIPELLDSSEASKPSRSALQEVQDDLEAIQARNAPTMSMGGQVGGRSGDAGFEKLLIQEAELQASSVIGDRIRMTVIARPTYLDAGTPDGNSIKRFGMLPEGASFASQSAGGVGGEVQLATATFGLRLGSTPRQFLVGNYTGGLRFRPGNGPITLLVERDTVKDSLLSYAGSRDPISNRVWGGVVANSLSVTGNWGNEVSGFYVSAGTQYITGTQVLENRRVDGNTGAYWRLLNLPQGSLTAGFNISAMHYDKNLRYYTLGQGGYFSPQRYLLFNVPVHWKGSYRGRLRYEASGSLGSQYFEEDTSPYFPTLTALQGKAGQFYAKRAATGANYSMEARVEYQLTSRWFFSGWLNVNNARDYASQAAGLSLTYTLRERPAFENAIPSIPDWRGTQLFSLR